MNQPVIYSIGHSNHTKERFVALLQQHRLRHLTDVRGHPYSRHVPQFNAPNIRQELRQAGLTYRLRGQELGGRPEPGQPELYGPDRRANYNRMAQTAQFKAGITELIESADPADTVIMCTEADPLKCHRTLLVAHQLQQFDISVAHILADGSVISHADLMVKLINQFHETASRHRPDQPPDQQLVQAAVDLQAARVAYRKT